MVLSSRLGASTAGLWLAVTVPGALSQGYVDPGGSGRLACYEPTSIIDHGGTPCTPPAVGWKAIAQLTWQKVQMMYDASLTNGPYDVEMALPPSLNNHDAVESEHEQHASGAIWFLTHLARNSPIRCLRAGTAKLSEKPFPQS